MKSKIVASKLAAVLSWVREAFRDPYKKEIEQYLAESVSVADLEQRMRNLTNRGML